MAADGRRGIVLPIVVTILGLAAIGVVEDIPVRHSIEHKLTVASTNALTKAGVTVDGVSFTGRDGTVRVDSTASGAKAYAIVSNINGVRVVRVFVTGAPGDGTLPPVSTPTPTPSVSLTAVPSGPATPSPTAFPTSAVPSPSPSEPATPTATPTAMPSPSAPTTPTPTASSAPKATPSPTPTAPSGGGTTLAQIQAKLNALGTVTFATGSSVLTSHDKAVIAGVARILKANPHVAIRVQGNTDSTGSAAFNVTMSRKRAQTVVNALHALGIATNRMTVVANGEAKPLVPNDTPAHRSMNRRVEFLATEV